MQLGIPHLLVLEFWRSGPVGQKRVFGPFRSKTSKMTQNDQNDPNRPKIILFDKDTNFDQNFTPNPNLASRYIFESPSPIYGPFCVLRGRVAHHSPIHESRSRFGACDRKFDHAITNSSAQSRLACAIAILVAWSRFGTRDHNFDRTIAIWRRRSQFWSRDHQFKRAIAILIVIAIVIAI